MNSASSDKIKIIQHLEDRLKLFNNMFHWVIKQNQYFTCLLDYSPANTARFEVNHAVEMEVQ